MDLRGHAFAGVTLKEALFALSAWAADEADRAIAGML
jgi:hypothetical protein